MSSYVSAALRRLVAMRADSLCEYCLVHEDDTVFGCEVDHIISEKHGGATEAENLAYACAFWEAWKTGNLAIIDKIFATDHVFHNAAGGVVRGRDRPKRGIMSYRTAFSNLHFLLEPVFAGADSEQYGLEETSFLLGRRYSSSSL